MYNSIFIGTTNAKDYLKANGEFELIVLNNLWQRDKKIVAKSNRFELGQGEIKT